MAKQKSISMRLKTAKSIEVKQKVLSDWSKNWQQDQTDVLNKLHYALVHGDTDTAKRMTSQLKGIMDKRFDGLNNVLLILTEQIKQSENDDQGPQIAETNPSEQILPEKAVSKSETDKLIEEIVSRYNRGFSVKDIGALNNIGYKKIIKILVTKGVYSSDIYDKIKNLRESGKSEQEIADKMCMTLKQLNDYTPYKKGIYNLTSPSDNARKLREYREKNTIKINTK